MSSASKGVLVVCDGAMAEYIKHVDQKMMEQDSNGQESSIIVKELDERHLWIREDKIAIIKQKVDQLQAENTFTRDSSLDEQQGAHAAQQKNKKVRKGVGGGGDDAAQKKKKAIDR